MKSSENICLNCDYELSEELYCPSCGQKTTIHNLSLKYLLSRFYIAFLDFDKKLFRSLKDIWVPNRIAKDFLRGGRKTYVNHLRFFFFSLVALLSLVAIHLKRQNIDMHAEERKAYVIDMVNHIDSLRLSSEYTCDTAFVKELRSKLLAELDDEDDDSLIEVSEPDESGSWSIQFTKGLKDRADSIPHESPKERESSGIDKSELTKLAEPNPTKEASKPPLDFNDLFVLEEQAFLDKYKIEGRNKTFFVSKIIKIVRNLNSAVSYALGNILWGIILATILFAFFLKLFYWRSHAFYAEHLMQVINFHSILAIIFSVLLLVGLGLDLPGWLYLIALIFAFIHMLISLKKYHSQGTLKTIVKSFLILFTYFVIWNFVIVLIIMVSVVLF